MRHIRGCVQCLLPNFFFFGFRLQNKLDILPAPLFVELWTLLKIERQGKGTVNRVVLSKVYTGGYAKADGNHWVWILQSLTVSEKIFGITGRMKSPQQHIAYCKCHEGLLKTMEIVEFAEQWKWSRDDWRKKTFQVCMAYIRRKCWILKIRGLIQPYHNFPSYKCLEKIPPARNSTCLSYS